MMKEGTSPSFFRFILRWPYIDCVSYSSDLLLRRGVVRLRLRLRSGGGQELADGPIQ